MVLLLHRTVEISMENSQEYLHIKHLGLNHKSFRFVIYITTDLNSLKYTVKTEHSNYTALT